MPTSKSSSNRLKTNGLPERFLRFSQVWSFETSETPCARRSSQPVNWRKPSQLSSHTQPLTQRCSWSTWRPRNWWPWACWSCKTSQQRLVQNQKRSSTWPCASQSRSTSCEKKTLRWLSWSSVNMRWMTHWRRWRDWGESMKKKLRRSLMTRGSLSVWPSSCLWLMCRRSGQI